LGETVGDTVSVVWDYAGAITGTQTVETKLIGLTTFEGNSAYEYQATTKGTNTVVAGNVTQTVDTFGKYYTRRTGDTEFTIYGAVLTAQSSFGGFAFSTETKTVYTPPYIDAQYGLALGQSLTQTYTGRVTTTTGGILGTPPTVTNTTATTSTVVKFAAIENVTVPAGTFRACRFESTGTSDPTAVSIRWLVVGKGAQVKSQSPDGSTISARSYKINGTAL
jgi:hypothetical protein